MFSFRQDGWPFCPSCHQDELYSTIMMAWDGQEPRPTLEECMAGELKCYACQWSNKQPAAGLKEEYVYGTAGSLVMVCPKCKREHFRQFYSPHEPQYCIWCGDVALEPLRAERHDPMASGWSEPLPIAQFTKPPIGLPQGGPVDLFPADLSPFVMFDIFPSTLCVVERLAAHPWKRRKFNPPCLRAGGRRSRQQVVRDPDPNFLIIDGKIIIGHPVTIRRLQEAMMQGPLKYSIGYEPPTHRP